MLVLQSRNVNHALPTAVAFFNRNKELVLDTSPRGKRTFEANQPVTTMYMHPTERVLFSVERDANPYFHFMEALWILAGRDDVHWPAFFLPKLAEYSDDGVIFHGAYGARMRSVSYAEGVGGATKDQLQNVINELHRDRDSRRAYLALWHPDLDSGYTGKDMPCNLGVAFKIRQGALNMTVFNRSNDMVWGAYGANVVQFSTIQEYVAAHVDASVGRYEQVSDSFHVYDAEPAWQRCRDNVALNVLDPYEDGNVSQYFGFGVAPIKPYPLVRAADKFDRELNDFMHATSRAMDGKYQIVTYPDGENLYFTEVAIPLFNSFCAYRDRDWDTALKWAFMCKAQDWQMAAAMWLERRRIKETTHA